MNNTFMRFVGGLVVPDSIDVDPIMDYEGGVYLPSNEVPAHESILSSGEYILVDWPESQMYEVDHSDCILLIPDEFGLIQSGSVMISRELWESKNLP